MNGHNLQEALLIALESAVDAQARLAWSSWIRLELDSAAEAVSWRLTAHESANNREFEGLWLELDVSALRRSHGAPSAIFKHLKSRRALMANILAGAYAFEAGEQDDLKRDVWRTLHHK